MNDNGVAGASGVTRRLAAHAATLRYEDIPAPAIAMAKRLLLDGLGCLLAGTAGAPGRSAAAMARRIGGAAQATVFTDGSKNSVCYAGFVNGITLYSVGLNDFLQRAGAHPGASVIPALLAVGEWNRSPGRDLLEAMAAGYDVVDRIGRAIMPSHRERGFHPTGTCGTFGATAAAGRLLGFDAERIACAFGIAGSQAAGLYEYINDGTSTIMFHAGRAAKNGIEAVLLTDAGLTGPATVLEGSRGFFRATADRIDAAAALADLGTRYAFDDVTCRPYFGCTSTIAASGATAQIMRRGLRAADIERIEVVCNPVVVKDNAEMDPKTLLAARLSLAYNVALVLARGDVLVGDLEERHLRDPQIRALLPLVRAIGDDAMPRFGCEVRAVCRDGRIEHASMRSWRGEADNPLLWNDVVEKFHRLVDPVVREADKERVVNAVENIETGDARDLAAVLGAAVARS